MAELVIEIKKLKDKMVNRLLILIFILVCMYYDRNKDVFRLFYFKFCFGELIFMGSMREFGVGLICWRFGNFLEWLLLIIFEI